MVGGPSYVCLPRPLPPVFLPRLPHSYLSFSLVRFCPCKKCESKTRGPRGRKHANGGGVTDHE